MIGRLLMSVALVTCLFQTAVAADPQKVALTVSRANGGDAQRNELATRLLVLLEAEAASYEHIRVVERMQIDLALNELILDRSRSADEAAQLTLGSLSTADLILTVQPAAAAEDETTPRVLVRVVEAMTAAIRGATVVSIDETTVDAAAVGIARYLSAIIATPAQAGVTVAVGTFDSVGRFDRLRPLESGVRDMVTRGLLNIGAFQVLQRSSMEELNREMTLIQSGLADQEQLPETLPTRKAAFYLRGTIDEQETAEARTVVVSAQLVHAENGETVQELQYEARPAELPAALARLVEVVGAHLIGPGAMAAADAGDNEFDEVEFLYRGALEDVRRFTRRCPIDFTHRRLEVPMEWVKDSPPQNPVKADSILGRHLLRKSIDRLESVLYIQPDRPAAAYALGYCYSYQLGGIHNAERAAELLRGEYDRDPESALGAQALYLLAELGFHHSEGDVASDREVASRQIAFAFSYMPAAHRTYQWARQLELLADLRLEGEEAAIVLEMMQAAASLTEQQETAHRSLLAQSVAELGSSLILKGTPEQRDASLQLMTKWGEGDDAVPALAAARTLGYLDRAALKDPDRAVDWFLRAARICEKHPDAAPPDARENFLWHAGKTYREAGDPAKALEVLEPIRGSSDPSSLNHGYVEVEVGACYEELGQPQKALEIYIAVAEQVRSVVDNTDVIHRIEALGVPIRDDRDINVVYVPGPDRRPNLCRLLATDNTRLFCAGGYLGQYAAGITIYDPATETWLQKGAEFGRATCLAYSNGQLWAGFDGAGLRRFDLATEQWTAWTTSNGLPDDRVTSLAIADDVAYAGVGTTAAGGIIEVTPDDEIRIFAQQEAPATAPTHLVVSSNDIFAGTQGPVHRLDRATNTWKRLEVHHINLFPGADGIWASARRREIYPFDPSGTVDDKYRAAWFRDQAPDGYEVHFVVEHAGQIWFGGHPWRRFKSAGFYRLDPKTGEFFMYGPRDGFQLSVTYETYAAVPINNRLWVATAAGLVEVEFLRAAAQ